MTIKKELQALNREMKSLEKKLEKLVKAIEKSEKPKPIASKEKAIKGTPSKKRAPGLTATDQVLRIINRSKKGVDTATLMKKTGFNQRKIWAIINRASKAGKIQRVDRGIYVGV